MVGRRIRTKRSIRRARHSSGCTVPIASRFSLAFARDIAVGAWRIMVGRVPVYLMDTNLEQNHPDDRELASRLYAGGPDVRLRQEWVLGVGGVRLLRAVGIAPQAWHANEGHATFM